eukprot:13588-Heterococcus_DN1.PRE.1
MEECCKAFGVVAVPLCRNAWHTIGSNHDAAAANGAAAFASAMANVFLCTRDVAEHVRRSEQRHENSSRLRGEEAVMCNSYAFDHCLKIQDLHLRMLPEHDVMLQQINDHVYYYYSM